MTDQILRTIDKHDRIGTDGVIALLQKPETEFGANLDPVRACLIGSFLDIKGETNGETLSTLRAWFAHAPKVMSRLGLITALDEGPEPTTLDQLLAMPANQDQTWCDGGRPANIAWALDDILAALAGLRHDS